MELRGLGKESDVEPQTVRASGAASARDVRDELGNMVRLAAYQNLVASRGLTLMTKEAG